MVARRTDQLAKNVDSLDDCRRIIFRWLSWSSPPMYPQGALLGPLPVFCTWASFSPTTMPCAFENQDYLLGSYAWLDVRCIVCGGHYLILHSVPRYVIWTYARNTYLGSHHRMGFLPYFHRSWDWCSLQHVPIDNQFVGQGLFRLLDWLYLQILNTKKINCFK